jgi:hypothetical protein
MQKFNPQLAFIICFIRSHGTSILIIMPLCVGILPNMDVSCVYNLIFLPHGSRQITISLCEDGLLMARFICLYYNKTLKLNI